MEPDNVDAQALAALTADLGDTPVEQAPVQPSVPSPEPVAPGVTSEQDSFSNIDPANLPPELQGVYKSLQADYTRKTQEVAPYRKLGMAPDELGNLVSWYQELSANPSAQLELYQNLHGYLSENGLLPNAEQPATPPESSWLDSLSEPEAPQTEPNGLEAEVARLAQRLKDMDEEAAIQKEAVELWEIEQGIREANPHYREEDIADIYKLSLIHGGNPLQGEAEFRAMRDRWMSEYLEQKGSVPAAHAQLPVNGHASEPFVIKDYADAERVALERMKLGEYNLFND